MESADHVCYSKITQVSQVEELCVQRPYLIPFLYLPCPLAAVMSCEVPQPEPLTHLHFGAQEGGRGESAGRHRGCDYFSGDPAGVQGFLSWL